MKYVKSITFILVLSIILGILPKFALAEETAPIAGADEGFLQPVEQKTEVPEGYIGIYTAEDMDAIRNNLSGKYILMADIDLAPLGNWEPIGRCETMIKNIYDDHMNIIDVDYIDKEPFCGIFDGNGHVLSGMNINKEFELTDTSFHSVGLFASAENCTIKNLGITDSTIFASDVVRLFAASIVGRQFQGVCIENCFSDTNITAIGSYVFAAGIASSWSDRHGIIRNCINYGDVKTKPIPDTVSLIGTLPEPYDYINLDIVALGIGFAEKIESSVNYGNVTAEISGSHSKIFGVETAGIGGYDIDDCTNYGNVKSSISDCSETATDLFNFFKSSGIGIITCERIINCKNYGEIRTETDKDTKIAPPSMLTGGIIADGSYCEISGCMNSGTVSAYCETDGEVNVGGIAGYMTIYNSSGSVKMSCNYGNVSAKGVSVAAGGIIGMTEILYIDKIAHEYINDMFNTGDITVQGSKAALCGGIFGRIICSVLNDESTFNVSNMYNIGKLDSTSQDNMGSIVGSIGFQRDTKSKFSIENAYYSSSDTNAIGAIEGDITCNRITELSYEQMHDKTSYKGFNFVNVWEFDENTNDGYPALRSITGNFNQEKLGDIDADGTISTHDAAIILKHCAGINSLDDMSLSVGDANCDFAVNSADAVAILRHCAGIINLEGE